VYAPFADLYFTAAAPSLSCRHPSIRTRCERFMRSVHTGCSRSSRRCQLLGALSFHHSMERGQGQGRSHRNSAFHCGAFKSLSMPLPVSVYGYCGAVRMPRN
jgi:hypothetical protein